MFHAFCKFAQFGNLQITQQFRNCTRAPAQFWERATLPCNFKIVHVHFANSRNGY